MILQLSPLQKPSISRGYPAFLTWRILAIPAGILASLYHRHLKSSFPQMLAQDMEIKSGIFPGEGIIIEAGKVSCIADASLTWSRGQWSKSSHEVLRGGLLIIPTNSRFPNFSLNLNGCKLEWFLVNPDIKNMAKVVEKFYRKSFAYWHIILNMLNICYLRYRSLGGIRLESPSILAEKFFSAFLLAVRITPPQRPEYPSLTVASTAIHHSYPSVPSWLTRGAPTITSGGLKGL